MGQGHGQGKGLEQGLEQGQGHGQGKGLEQGQAQGRRRGKAFQCPSPPMTTASFVFVAARRREGARRSSGLAHQERTPTD